MNMILGKCKLQNSFPNFQSDGTYWNCLTYNITLLKNGVFGFLYKHFQLLSMFQ